jgi:hypothetical protein
MDAKELLIGLTIAVAAVAGWSRAGQPQSKKSTVTFQEGVNGYAGTIDIEIWAVSPPRSRSSWRKEPNDDLKQAQHVPLNVSVAGVIEEAGVDYYAVTLKKGQRLAAEVEGVRLGGELTDTVLTVFGPDGQLLAAVDDTPCSGRIRLSR